MEEKVNEILRGIGLGKVEVDTYLDLLRSRISTAAEIAKRTHQHRSNVYDALKRLQQRGFITEVIEQNKRFFESKLPDVLLSYLKQKESEVTSILPALQEFSSRKIEKETNSTSYGMARVRAVLSDLLDHREEVYFWGISDEIEKLLGEAFIADFLKKRAKKKKNTMLLYNGKPKEVDSLSSINRQKIKYLPKKEQDAMMVISGEEVFIFAFNDPVMVIDMKGETVSGWYMSQFDILWRTAKVAFSFNDHVVKKATTLKEKSKKYLKKLFSDNQ